MERLAESGMRFTNAHAAPVCSPTRTSIMTGQSPVRHHVTNWTLYPNRDESGRTPRLGPPSHWSMSGLQPGGPTLASILRDAGYRTIHCGKAHWGAIGTAGSDPRALGFDVNIAGHSAGAPGDYQGENNYGNRQPGDWTLPWGVPGLTTYHGKPVHLTEALTIEASREVEKAVEAKRPFFLYMAHYAVHTPIQEHRPFISHFRGGRYPGTDIAIPEVEASYASLVEGMDASLGQLLAKVEELGESERTLVIFASDNGGLSAHTRGMTPRGSEKDTHNWPLRGGKGSAYEGGVRVPLIVSWARASKTAALQSRISVVPGGKSDVPVISEDLFAAICSLSGGSIPREYQSQVDGMDFLNRARETSVKLRSRALLFHYPHVWGPTGPGYEPHSSIEVGDWKAIYFYGPRRWELYHLSDDLGEASDLVSVHPEKLRELSERMRIEFTVRGAQYPIDLASGDEEPPLWFW